MEEKKYADLAENGPLVKREAWGAPKEIDWRSAIDADTGLLRGAYQLQGSKVPGMDMKGIEALRARAMQTGPSDSLKLQLQRQGLEQSQGMDKAAAQSNSSVAKAMSDLAMRGGMRSGSRERIASDGARGLLGAQQGVAMQGMNDRNALNIADEQMKQQALTALPGAESSYMQGNINQANYQDSVDKYNIGNALNENTQKRYSQNQAYTDAMKNWGALETSVATQNSGGGKK